MEHKELNLESKESSASGDCDNGFCSEAPQIGAAGLNPVGQGVGETPLTWWETLVSQHPMLGEP